MAQRPTSTKNLILATLGENHLLTEYTHHGLAELDLGKVYPALDLDEALLFAASSWAARRDQHYRQRVQHMTLPEIFNHTYSQRVVLPIPGRTITYDNAYQWMNSKKQISCADARIQDKSSRCNPHTEKLEARLRQVGDRDVRALKERLGRPRKEWIFGCDYERRKRALNFDTTNLEIMDFQTEYPRKGKIVGRYATEINKIIRSYPRDLIEVPEDDWDPSGAQQMTFFGPEGENLFLEH